VQGEAFESSEADELIYPVHDGTPVALVAPEVMWNHFGHNSAAEC
jgi:hypothetical protein